MPRNLILQRMCKEKNITLGFLSMRTGVSVPYLSDINRYKRKPSLKLVTLLAEILCQPVDQIGWKIDERGKVAYPFWTPPKPKKRLAKITKRDFNRLPKSCQKCWLYMLKKQYEASLNPDIKGEGDEVPDL